MDAPTPGLGPLSGVSAANDNDPPPAAPALPVPLAAQFGWLGAFATAQAEGRIVPAVLITGPRL